MTRGVRQPGQAFFASRIRTLERGTHAERKYRLEFKHNQGEPYIHIKFSGREEHDVINVMDYVAPQENPITHEVFMGNVNAYMSTLSDADLKDWALVSGVS